MRIFISLMPFLIFYFKATTQEIKNSPLSIGDTVPNVTFGNFYQDSNLKIKVADLKDKLIILDFWNIECKACIAAMPKMDSLHKLFDGKIQIIPITYNSEQEVKSTFDKINFLRPALPMIVGDTFFSKLFPHEGDPFHVWINKNGIVQYITWSHNATEKNIKAVLNNEKVKIALRYDYGVNLEKPLISDKNGNILKMAKYYSIFLQLHEQTSSSRIFIKRDSVTNKPTMIRILNASALALFKFAYNYDLFGFDINAFSLSKNNRILLELKNPKEFFPPLDKDFDDEWREANIHSYEIMIPQGSNLDIYKIMQDDLNKYLKYEGRIEKRKIKCLVLTRISKVDKIKTKSENAEPRVSQDIDGSISIRNMPINQSLIKQLILATQHGENSIPIIDETNYNGAVDIKIRKGLNNIADLKKELNAYDLDLIEKVTDIDMLIIKEKN